MTCPECNGRGISYVDERTGEHDHMNAHLCGKCSGTGRVPSLLLDSDPVVCNRCHVIVNPNGDKRSHELAETTTHNDAKRTFLVIKCPQDK